jgi:hypothetical protein
MKTFLNDFMNVNRNLNEDVANNLKNQFYSSIERAHEALGNRAFRPQRAMNVAVFDAIMVAILESPNASASAIKTAYENLIADEVGFIRMSSESTSNEANVHGRINMAIEAIHAAT